MNSCCDRCRVVVTAVLSLTGWKTLVTALPTRQVFPTAGSNSSSSLASVRDASAPSPSASRCRCRFIVVVIVVVSGCSRTFQKPVIASGKRALQERHLDRRNIATDAPTEKTRSLSRSG